MLPAQQVIPRVTHADAHIGAHNSTTASRHTHAASIFPGAIGAWSDRFISCSLSITQLCAVFHLPSLVLRRGIPGTSLDLPFLTPQTQFMAHVYLLFDFATDEEKAQLARHKLETWKQAFRLDKKLLYKFDRATSGDGAAPSERDKPVKVATAKAKSKGKVENSEATSKEPVRLMVRLDFSGHEKLSQQRWVDRIPSEDPFKGTPHQMIKSDDKDFSDTEKQFEELA